MDYKRLGELGKKYGKRAAKKGKDALMNAGDGDLLSEMDKANMDVVNDPTTGSNLRAERVGNDDSSSKTVEQAADMERKEAMQADENVRDDIVGEDLRAMFDE